MVRAAEWQASISHCICGHRAQVAVRCSGVTFLSGAVASVEHTESYSSVKLADGRCIQGRLVLDATGHKRKLIKYDRKFDPGYQGAYGIIAGEWVITEPANFHVTLLNNDVFSLVR